MKLKHFGYLFFTTLVLLAYMQACSHESYSDPNGAICFERDILPIFNSKNVPAVDVMMQAAGQKVMFWIHINIL